MIAAADKSGTILSFKYSGIIDITPGVGAVLSGDPSAKTTPFGNACEFSAPNYPYYLQTIDCTHLTFYLSRHMNR